MYEREIRHQFYSPLGPWMRQFIEQKQACGYRYLTQSYRLRRFDQFLCAEGLSTVALPRELVQRWLVKQPHERASTQRLRIAIVRQFAGFLAQHELPVYIPEPRVAITRTPFTPRILTREEVRKLLQAAGQLPRDGRVPWRHLIMPEVFRLLYGCGLRLGEVLHLNGADVDLQAGVLTIRASKFNKDRLVPMAASQTVRLQRYCQRVGERAETAPFFPAPDGGYYSHSAVYGTYRQLLRTAGISHGGRGKGPRVHDLRATFAVHRLERWYRQGTDLGAKLPVLATYLGHESLSGTQVYLRLTAELFPDIVTRLDAQFGDVIPRQEAVS